MYGAAVAVEDEVSRFHREALVVDLHNDLLTKLVLRGGDLGRRHGAQALYNPLAFDIDVPKLAEGGVDALGCLLFAGMGLMARRRFWKQLEEFERLFEKHPQLTRARSAGDAAPRPRRPARSRSFSASKARSPSRTTPAALQKLADAGVRFFGICWNKTNKAGVSSFDKKNDGGLSTLGREIIGECNRLGIMVDVSHASKRTFWDLVEASTTPVFSSHSGCEALKAHPRNLDDEQLRAVGKKGGVVGIIFAANYLGGLFDSTRRDHLRSPRARGRRRRRGRGRARLRLRRLRAAAARHARRARSAAHHAASVAARLRRGAPEEAARRKLPTLLRRFN